MERERFSFTLDKQSVNLLKEVGKIKGKRLSDMVQEIIDLYIEEKKPQLLAYYELQKELLK